jgi:TolA-binding protein
MGYPLHIVIRNIMRHNRVRPALLIACTLLSFQGCVVWDFAKVRYENVFGYFNTYYNAAQTFDDAMKLINEQKRSMIQPKDVSVPINDPGMQKKQRIMMNESTVPPQAAEKFNKVIEKCSRILVFYPRSKWIDNSLMLIGKSYFFLRESGKAERKFKELLKDYPESSFTSEAILWLGKTYFQMKKYDIAETQLLSAIEKGMKQNEKAVIADAYFTLGEMALEKEQHEEAAIQYRKAVEYSVDNDQSIDIQMALARENEKIGDKKGAMEAYRAIMNRNPSKELMFIAELNYTRLSRETGALDQAANALLDMLDNPAYLDYDSKIQLEIGHLYRAYEDYKSAVDQYTYVDTTFRNVPESAEAFFAVGEINEFKFKNYDKAFDAYTNAKRFPGLPVSKSATKKSDDFGEYRRQRNMMSDLDTLFFYVLHPDSLAVRDSLHAINEKLERERRIAAGDEIDPVSEKKKEIERFSRRRPHGRNTGKVNPYAGKVKGLLPSFSAPGTPSNQSSLVPTYRKVNLRALSQDSVFELLSMMRMEMGSIMYNKIANFDSALYYYQLALNGKLPEGAQAQTYYTLAEIARRQGDEKSARDFEDLLIKGYPKYSFAQSIMQARGMELPKDTNTAAREAYDRAAQLLEAKKYKDGVIALKWMTEQYPFSDQAVRAKLAIALTYEDHLNQGDEALKMYKQMVKDHASSKYSQRAKDVLAALEKKIPEPGSKSESGKPEEKPGTQQKTKQLVIEEKAVKTDSVTTKKSSDPTRDLDFPLGVPGKNQPKNPPRRPQVQDPDKDPETGERNRIPNPSPPSPQNQALPPKGK